MLAVTSKKCFNSQEQNLPDTDFLQYFSMIYNDITLNIENRSKTVLAHACLRQATNSEFTPA